MVKAVTPVLRDNLIRCAKAYTKQFGGTLDTVGRAACNDAKFFTQLHDGHTSELGTKKSFTVRKYDDLIAWFIDKLGDKMPELKNTDH